jgi:antitoxin component YwqK of YwqJK toxin-antitoxin module
MACPPVIGKWFRQDGTKLRSGYFKNGEQVGEWTTHDKSGKVQGDGDEAQEKHKVSDPTFMIRDGSAAH